MSGPSTGAENLLLGTISCTKGFLSEVGIIIQNVFYSITGVPSWIWSHLKSLGENSSLTSLVETSNISTIPSTLLSSISSGISSISSLVLTVCQYSVDTVSLATTYLGDSAGKVTQHTWVRVTNLVRSISGHAATGVTSVIGVVGD